MVHKRPKIALIRVVSVTGYSLSFILLCLAASIQMRWVPTSDSKTAKADRCVLPTNSAHLKLTAPDAAPGSNTLSFVHPGLRKGDLLPKFATTRIAKQIAPERPAPVGAKSGRPAAVSHNQNVNPVKVRAAKNSAIPDRPHHTPPEARPTRTSKAQQPSAGRPPMIARAHHTPPAAGPSRAATLVARAHHAPPETRPSRVQTLVSRPHHTPPEATIQAARAPLPLNKPALQDHTPARIGAIVDPASATGPERQQNLKKRAPSSATAGFAITGAARRTKVDPNRPEILPLKPPMFRKKPVQRTSRPGGEAHCLSLALYYEARAEGSEAQIGLAKVIMSRVKSRHYPNTVCGVVFQNAHLRGRCAFSFACDGLLERPQNPIAWTKSKILALNALCGKSCSRAKIKPHTVRNAKQDAQGALQHRGSDKRQITDRKMTHMGRDGVNAFSTTLTPVF